MRKIYISAEIQQLLVTNKRYDAQLFMLGANEAGVITEAITLPKDGGCENMPGITHGPLARAYVQLTKLGLKPVAFGYRTSHDNGLTEDIFNFLNVPFICSSGYELTVEMATAGRPTWRSTSDFEVCVVDKNYDPKAGCIVPKKKTLTRARPSSAKPKHKEKHRGSSKR